MRPWILAALLLTGCAPPPAPSVTCEAGGVRVRGGGLQRVDVLEDGVRLARRKVTGGDEVFVPVPAEAGSTVRKEPRWRDL